ncbi:TolC family protein [Aeoliella sp. SH292]|uniref:TolC family protein n=1 Tax=Aeoliella sp. SH292 TaxID=3454464 RepID=UPI003F9D4451
MSRHTRSNLSLALVFVMLATGCQPTQPFFFREDGDLSHYVGVSTDIEFPDVEEPTLDEVTQAQRPITLKNMDDYQMWDLTLEEVTRITLCNSQVMRQLGGRVQQNAPDTISRTIVNAAQVQTTYDPALVETGNGQSFGSPFDGVGVESALSEFDVQMQSSLIWQRNDRPVNFDPGAFGTFFAQDFQQDLGDMNTSLVKNTADGGRWGVRNSTNYDNNNNGNRQTPSDWRTGFDAFFNQPLLQGRGTQYTRIAGTYTFDQYAANAPNSFDGVMIARLRTDLALADFEGGIRNLMRDVEQAYWELYFAYRDLDARKQGLESSRGTWARVNQLYLNGLRRADAKAQAEAQFFQFRGQVEQSLTELLRAETRLRYIMGLAATDGRLIRPIDEPTIARVDFDWAATQVEALARRVEVRKQKWQIKRRELELIAARNHLLPRLDAVGRYRWLGAGNDLVAYDNDPNMSQGRFGPGTSAFESLTSGDFQEWELGFQLAVPLGFRKQLDGVRHVQLLLARDRAILQDLELEVSHQLTNAVRDIDYNHQLSQTRFNNRVAAEREVQAVELAEDKGLVTLDLLLDAQRRRAEAESAYYRSLVDYNLAILDMHFQKGSLLDFNGVYLAEGPWPGKAYFDALRRARQRDASLYLDYGFTRPNVMSRGPVSQSMGEGMMAPQGEYIEGEQVPMGEPTPVQEWDGETPATDMGVRNAPPEMIQQAAYQPTAASGPQVQVAHHQATTSPGRITYAANAHQGQTNHTTSAAAANPSSGGPAQR